MEEKRINTEKSSQMSDKMGLKSVTETSMQEQNKIKGKLFKRTQSSMLEPMLKDAHEC